MNLKSIADGVKPEGRTSKMGVLAKTGLDAGFKLGKGLTTAVDLVATAINSATSKSPQRTVGETMEQKAAERERHANMAKPQLPKGPGGMN